MQIRAGASAELASGQWRKFDVELNERDVQALLYAAGLKTDLILTTNQTFRLLEVEAERLCVVWKLTRCDYPQDIGLEELRACEASKRKVYDQLRRDPDLTDPPWDTTPEPAPAPTADVEPTH